MSKIRFAMIITALTVCNAAFAGRPIKFGGQLGVNLPFTSVSNLSTKPTSNDLVGFHFGPVLEVSPIDALSINTAILFNYNTIELNYNKSTTSQQIAKDINRIFSLQVPLLVEGRYKVLKVLALYGEAGPYAELGLLAMAKQVSNTAESDYKSFDYNKLDYGLKLGLGVELAIVKLGMSYSFGFPTHTLSNGVSNVELQNRMLQFHIAIR